jgi:MYXO-CTERM domain-containing protein
VHECEPDPCYAVSCETGSYCRAGTCVKACPSSCPSGQRCQDGNCVGNPCTTVTCGGNDYCDPKDGQCKPSGFTGIQCMIGMTCVQATGRCELNPCGVTRCQPGDSFRVLPDGVAQCERDPTAPGTVTMLSPGGGGLTSCTCRLGDSGGGPRSGGAWPLLLAALAGVRFIRRRRGNGK